MHWPEEICKHVVVPEGASYLRTKIYDNGKPKRKHG